MDYKFETVDLSLIHWEDHRFKIAVSSSQHALASSISRAGLISPPVLWTVKGRFVVICGFSRIAACHRLGWPRIPARCLDETTPGDQLALMAVAESVSNRALTIVEQARAWDLLCRHFPTVDEAIEAANTVGFALSAKLIEKLNKVNLFGEEIWQGLHEGSIGLPVALRIQDLFASDDAEALGALLREMRWSLTRQKMALDWVETIVHRDDVPLKKLLTNPQLNHWRHDNQLDPIEKSKNIHDYLEQQCYPTISAFHRRYSRALNKIHIGQGIEFLPPPHFEGQTFSLKIDFSDYQTCLQRLQEIQVLTESPDFKALLNPPFTPDNP